MSSIRSTTLQILVVWRFELRVQFAVQVMSCGADKVNGAPQTIQHGELSHLNLYFN